MLTSLATASHMHTLRILPLALTVIICLACASGPIPERSPRHLRKSIRHLNKGTQFYAKGCFPHALQQFRKSHEHYAAADHMEGVAASLNSLANTYYRLNDTTGALANYDEAIEIYRLLNDRTGLVRAMTNKSAALITSGQLDAAAAVLEGADKLAKDRGLLTGQRLKARAILLMHRREHLAAEKLLKQALEATLPEAYSQFADVQYAMGHLLLTSQRPAQAITHLNSALEADRKLGAYHGIAQDLAALGACRAQMGQHDQAVIDYKRSLKIFALLADTPKVEKIREKLEDSARSAGADIQAALLWVERWQAGEREANICR